MWSSTPYDLKFGVDYHYESLNLNIYLKFVLTMDSD